MSNEKRKHKYDQLGSPVINTVPFPLMEWSDVAYRKTKALDKRMRIMTEEVKIVLKCGLLPARAQPPESTKMRG